MLKDTKSLGNNKAPACESRGFVLKKKVCFLTHLHSIYILSGQILLIGYRRITILLKLAFS